MDDHAKKRVLIAKDVLKLLDLRKIKAVKMSYFIPPKKFEEDVLKKFSEKKIKYLPAPAKCEACAKGSLFYAHLMRFDRVLVESVVVEQFNSDELEFDGPDVCAPLLNYFDGDQLALIEQVFEGWETNDRKDFEPFLKKPAPTRLRLIMKNIVKNKGTFIPDPKWYKSADPY